MQRWFAENVSVEVHAYPEIGTYAIINNADTDGTSVVYDGNGMKSKVYLKAGEIQWHKMSR